MYSQAYHWALAVVIEPLDKQCASMTLFYLWSIVLPSNKRSNPKPCTDANTSHTFTHCYSTGQIKGSNSIALSSNLHNKLLLIAESRYLTCMYITDRAYMSTIAPKKCKAVFLCSSSLPCFCTFSGPSLLEMRFSRCARIAWVTINTVCMNSSIIYLI